MANKRQKLSVMQLCQTFPDEASSRQWFEKTRWPEGRCCPHCGSQDTREVKNERPMPYFCRDCKTYFSVRTGTALEASNLPLKKWLYAIFLFIINLKGVSSHKLANDINVSQKTAWFMLHRLRNAWGEYNLEKFKGPIEVDEIFTGGRKKNMSKAKRAKLKGQGPKGKALIVGAVDRPTGQVATRAIETRDRETLHTFIEDVTAPGARVFTDEWPAYREMDREHESVNHGAEEYVRGDVHTNTIECVWSMYNRAVIGVYHSVSRKHRHRYADEMAGRKNGRKLDTLDQMGKVAATELTQRLLLKDLMSGEQVCGPKKGTIPECVRKRKSG